MTINSRRKAQTARKSWVQALFDLGAMPPQAMNSVASQADAADIVRRVETAERNLERYKP